MDKMNSENKIELDKIGFTSRFIAEANEYNDLFVGRISSQYKDLYKVICESGEIIAEVSGKFRFETSKLSDFPTVGDFVMIDRITNESGNAIIHHLLSRKSAFIRKAAGTGLEEQIVASNIDKVFICMSLNHDFNLRRLERYLTIGWDSGATSVIVLTKSDLCDDIEQKLLDVESVAIGVDILVTSSMSEDGYIEVSKQVKEGQTIAFIGSTGVGKSTLINRLIGRDALETNEIRKNEKGRHTTTRRELIVLENGGMVIDTPGMRELGIESGDISKTFSDIDEYVSMCKFSDCTHTTEPGCAVRKAIEDGLITEERLQSYKKLKKEEKYAGLTAKQIENTKMNEIFTSVGGMKNARKYTKKEKNK